MRFRILGPVEVVVDGRALPVNRPQERAVLAVLALDADRVVPAGRLVAALWGDRPPPSARTQVQVCVSRIRAALRDAGLDPALSTVAGGYRLAVDGGCDYTEFTGCVRRARSASAAGAYAVAATTLRQGLALWRGSPLTGAAGAFVDAAAATLDAERLDAQELLADAELAQGRYAAAVDLLTPLAAAHPLREGLVGALMLALAGHGQQAQALALYERTRSRLCEELGVAPGDQLTRAHLRVLRQELPEQQATPARQVTRPAPATPTTGTPTPAQLPAGIPMFSGRRDALAALDALLPADPTDAPTTVVISAIGGTAGVGKTALAVHWMHRVAHRFPDGQLYVNLRGFDPDGRGAATGEVLRGFLAALGVHPHRVPADADQQAGLYRSLMAGRRMAVLLDNARDAEQVRPLLPGAPGCLVLVTSRDRLTGLVVAEGARTLPLDLLTVAECRQLLASRVGPDRVAAEPAAVDDIVHACARLPLALAVVAARIAATPGTPLADHADELRETPAALTPFTAADPRTDVRAVFSWSYRTLDPPAARLFRLLGLHPGPEVSVAAAASLAGEPVPAVRPLLAALVEANLLTQRRLGRFDQHDLLRAYARELAVAVDSADDRDAAARRLLDHCLHTAHAADLGIDPYRLATSAPLPKPDPAVTVLDHDGQQAALAWLRTERPVLLALVGQAADTGHDWYAWQLAATLVTFLDRQGHWHDLAACQATALAAARRDRSVAGQVQAHRGLAIAYTWWGRTADALAAYGRSLDLNRELGDREGQADAYLGLCWVCARDGDLDAALDRARSALALYRAVDSPAGQAKALNNIGWLQARRGAFDTALTCCTQALELHERHANRHGAALSLDNLGYIRHQLGEYGAAADCYERALALHRRLGDRYDEADVLVNLGETHDAAGDRAAARTAWRAALDIYTDLGHPDAEQVRRRLDG
ncbi:BTAD domain-containing putative transcriptional regulator [Solwaraspora sp. WMMD791]|uniref:AfsR/SARP family transcriptional regulator n=1 Tax=Solwaraspora sp. WMMD791 TaxID=3016086 RepID=UPI00249AF82A|nr:BTAD domain-containing putative transcriptional regulator [Solwaraspora sp. WMMD791]WFE26979.1 BTAD domain-containing putative transcriptional regulator [Solwaraspora sp. WMMD791]